MQISSIGLVWSAALLAIRDWSSFGELMVGEHTATSAADSMIVAKDGIDVPAGQVCENDQLAVFLRIGEVANGYSLDQQARVQYGTSECFCSVQVVRT